MSQNTNNVRGGFSSSAFHIKTPFGKINPKDIPGISGNIKQLEDYAKNKGIPLDKLLPHIGDYTKIFAKTATKHKLGQSLFVKLVDHALDSISNHGKNKVSLVHENENIGSINNGRYITKTNCHVGHPSGKRIKKALQGAFH